MKRTILAFFAMLSLATTANAQWYNNTNTQRSRNNNYGTVNSQSTYVNGYTRSNGTYVSGYNRTQRNNTNHDNYSTSGNSNIYTGTTGYRARDYSSQSYNYGSGHSISTGPRGGQYYVNSNGRKVYVPKRSW